MRVITDREVYSYAPGDEKPKKAKKEKEKKTPKEWGAEQKDKLDKLNENPLFQAGASAFGQFLQNKYGQSPYSITTDQQGNLSLGDVSGGNAPVLGETELQKSEREKSEKRKKTIIVSSIIGGVVVLGIIAFVVYKRSSKKSNKK